MVHAESQRSIFCGHATIAAAVLLAELGKFPDTSSVAFSTRSGFLAAERRGSRFILDFPAAITEQSCEPPPTLVESLGLEALYVGRSKFDFLIEAGSEKGVREVAPDFKQLASVRCRGVVVTALSDDPKFDFVSRFFAPAVGIDQDPVTGSAHCLLAPFWGGRLGQVQNGGLSGVWAGRNRLCGGAGRAGYARR